MIGIGVIALGPEIRGSRFDVSFRIAWDAVDSIVGAWQEGDTPRFIVAFVVSGSVADAVFVGQRITLFSRKKKLVQIEVAVPKELVLASAARVHDFFIEALRQAARTAAEVFEKRRAGKFDLAKANETIDKVQEKLAHDSSRH